MASAHPLTDHDEIRAWAEERDGKPSCVKGTGGGEDVGMIRLDFPGYSGADSLQEISWDEWFEKFDESGLALLVQEETADGQQSNFNKLVSRETAAESERKPSRSGRSTGRKTATKSAAGAAKSTRSAGKTTKTAAKSTRTAKTKTAAKPAARTAKTGTKTAAKSSSRTTAAKSKSTGSGGKTAKSGGSSRSTSSSRSRSTKK